MSRWHRATPWVRYADDGLLHFKTELAAKQLLVELKARFEKCGLELHSDKTKIIYCKDSNREGEYPNTEFDFLGYTFRNRSVKNGRNKMLFVSFSPAVSKKAINSMRAKTRERRIGRRTELELKDISQWHNPVLKGWLNYYGRYNRSAMLPVLRHFNKTLVTWVTRKYKKLNSKAKAIKFLDRKARKEKQLFEHWKLGICGFA